MITRNILEIEIAIDIESLHTRVPDTRKISFLQRINSINDPKKYWNNWLTIRSYHRWRTDYGNMYHKKTLYQVRVSLDEVLDSFYFLAGGA